MIDGWSWFRTRADAELGPTPAGIRFALDDLVRPGGPVRRRRLAEVGAAAGVVAVFLTLIGVANALGGSGGPPGESTLPVPDELTAVQTGVGGGPPLVDPRSGASPSRQPGGPTASRGGAPVTRTDRAVPIVTPDTNRVSAPASPTPPPRVTTRPTATTTAPPPTPTVTPTASPTSTTTSVEPPPPPPPPPPPEPVP